MRLATTHIPPPQRIPGHRLGQRVGSDSLGVWYDAHQERLDRRVTAKLLRPEISHVTWARRGFLAEIERLAPLSHPNLTCVLDARHEGELALVVEWIGATSLARELEAGRLGRAAALRRGRDVSHALAYLARDGLACRNLSPPVVRILPDGKCRLVALGNIVPFERLEHSPDRLAQDRAYAPPEQLDGTAPLGPRAASYMIAALLLHLLTGRTANAAGIAPGRLRAEAAGGWSPLATLLLACMQREPGLRPPPAEVAGRLDELLAHASRPAPRARPKRRR
jgi:serine/threonine protein kinase